MTTVKRNWLIATVAASTCLSICLWVLVVVHFKGKILCLFAPCDSWLTVTGELQVQESEGVLECGLALVAPARPAGLLQSASEPRVLAYEGVGRSVEAHLSLSPWSDRYQVAVMCPGYQQYSTRVFSARELADQRGKLALGKVVLTKRSSG